MKIIELGQLLNMQDFPQFTNGCLFGQKVENLSGQECNVLDAFSKILASLTLTTGNITPAKKVISTFEPLILTEEKGEKGEKGEKWKSLDFCPSSVFLNFCSQELGQIEQNQKDVTDLLKDCQTTIRKNHFCTTTLNANKLCDKPIDNVYLPNDSELLNQGSFKQTSSIFIRDNEQVPINLGSKVPIIKTNPFQDSKNLEYSLEKPNVLGQLGNKGIESQAESHQLEIPLSAKFSLAQLKTDSQEANASKFNSFLTKESDLQPTFTSSQTLTEFFKDEGINQINKEPELTTKELPEFLLKQIKNNFKLDKLTGTSQLSLRLKPEELGKMTVQLFSQDGQVRVKILTENTRAREVIEQNLVHLKQTFTSQGIKCNHIDVQVNTDSSFNQFMGQHYNPFNHARYGPKGKYDLGNARKELQIEDVSESSDLSTKRFSDGLELFA